MVVMVEWTMRKENRRFGFANLKSYFQEMVFQGEFYLIQADNESGLAKTILREVQNADSLRALYHDGIQVHTGPELERYLQRMLDGRAQKKIRTLVESVNYEGAYIWCESSKSHPLLQILVLAAAIPIMLFRFWDHGYNAS